MKTHAAVLVFMLFVASLAQSQGVLPATYLKASNTDAGDRFGGLVAIDGDTLVVGAPFEASTAVGVDGNQSGNSASGAGAAYVFVYDGTAWSQQAYLKASNTQAGDGFGEAVAISGDTIIVGAQFEDSNATGVDGNQSDNSASSAGAAYVFVRNGTTWSQQAYLKPINTNAGHEFGSGVAVSGDRVVVGSAGEGGYSGAVFVFERTGTNWSWITGFKASNPQGGGLPFGDRFGESVDMDGNTVVVGAPREDSAATGVDGDQADNSAGDSGAVYVFFKKPSGWVQEAYIKASNSGAQDGFGESVAISGDVLVVGASMEDSHSKGVDGDGGSNAVQNAGAAYVFERTGSAWSQGAYLKATNTDPVDGFGSAVDVAGATVVAGASSESSGSTGLNGNQSQGGPAFSGAAYVYERDGNTWFPSHYVKAQVLDVSDAFGSAVALSGDTLVVGVPHEDSMAQGVGGDANDDSQSFAGAAWVLGLPPTGWSTLGGGSDGLGGGPQAFGYGTLDGGTFNSLLLAQAPAGTPALLWLSFAPTPFAALGGTVHAFPFSLQVFLMTSGGGTFQGGSVWPTGLTPGLEVWFQFVVADASVPDGLSLSNGLKAITP